MPPAPVSQSAEASRESSAIFCNVTSKNFDIVKGQIPPAMIPGLKRDFTPKELEEIFARANLHTAPVVDEPACLMILGPSAVGKSFISGAKASQLFGALQHAVIVDGTEFREVHAGFQAVRMHGQEHSVLHADAWSIFKKVTLEVQDGKVTLKRRILREALASRRHLIIPDCCNNMKRLDELLAEVRAAGYQMHAVCLWAPLSVTRTRGEERSVREGKLWSAKDYPMSAKGTLAMAMRWLDGMRDEPSAYASLELWDNTQFPAVEVGLERYADLVMLSNADADAHAAALDDQHHRSHDHLAQGNQQARDRLKEVVQPKDDMRASRRKSSRFEPGRVSGAAKDTSPRLGGGVGRFSAGLQGSWRASTGGGVSGTFSSKPGRLQTTDEELQGGGESDGRARMGRRRRDLRRRLEGAATGLLVGMALGVVAGRLWWSLACNGEAL